MKLDFAIIPAFALIMMTLLTMAMQSQAEHRAAAISAQASAAEGLLVIVNMTESGFSPATLTVDSGDRVAFVNTDSGEHWPASGVHPTHQEYPEQGGCIGSRFDACRGLAHGENFTFVFRWKGTWSFHDHLNPWLNGMITVR